MPLRLNMWCVTISVMDAGAIREVERDPKEGIVVTIERGADHVDIPEVCAICLGQATQHLPAKGVNWLEFPYCDECAPEPKPAFWILRRRGGLLGMAAKDLGGARGKAVRLLLGPSDTTRLAFANEDYARRFVEANGAELPDE